MAGTWATISVPQNSGAFSADIMILLTDGSVLIHNAYVSLPITPAKQWLRLTPDMSQSDPAKRYANGTWSSQTLDMEHAREYFASGVLKDGRVFVLGGEYSDDPANTSDTTLGEIFDPQANAWSAMAKPASMDFVRGDASSAVLPDGRVLFGGATPGQATFDPTKFNKRAAIWNPADGTWVEAGRKFQTVANTTKDDGSEEEGFSLLQDGTVLAVEVANAPKAEKYVPSLDAWVPAGSVPNPLVIQTLLGANVYEVGPALALPDGSLFAIGATGQTALYTADSDPSKPGTWKAGPSFPADTTGNTNWPTLTAIDAPACLMPSGKVIFVAGSAVPLAGDYFSFGTTFLEYDPTSATIGPLDAQPTALPAGTYTYQCWFILLPTGQLLCGAQAGSLYLYTPGAGDPPPDASWRPGNLVVPHSMFRGFSYSISGTQLNGLSQAVSYGDDGQMATNYPIVQLTSVADGTSAYARTYDFSTMGITPGTKVPDDLQSCMVQIPGNLKPGKWNLVVIANGIPSEPVPVQIGVFVMPHVEIIAQIIAGVIQDGGGIAVVGGHIIRIPPWDPGYEILSVLSGINSVSQVRGLNGAAIRSALWHTIGNIAAGQVIAENT
jgi:hypothetical protein